MLTLRSRQEIVKCASSTWPSISSSPMPIIDMNTIDRSSWFHLEKKSKLKFIFLFANINNDLDADLYAIAFAVYMYAIKPVIEVS